METTSEMDMYLQNGFVIVSVGYRLLPFRYFYSDEEGNNKIEEFVNINEDLSLTLDAKKDYTSNKVHISYYEMLPKALFDASQAIEYIIQNAGSLGVDPHKMVFAGDSSGSGIANYLAYIYHGQHASRFTVKAMVLGNVQLNYPAGPFQDTAWRLLAEVMGSETTLKTIMEDAACPVIFAADRSCREEFDYDVCNTTWHEYRMSAYCNSQKFGDYTISDALQLNNWAGYVSSSYDANLGRLWDFADNIKQHPNPDVKVYLVSSYNGTDEGAVAHHAAFNVAYSRILTELQIPFVAYFIDYNGIKEDQKSEERAFGWQDDAQMWILYNYISKFIDWRRQPEIASLMPVSSAEKVMFACLALSMTCEVE